MTGAELAPLELAGRLALAFGLAVFLGLAFEEVYKREDRSSPGGVRTFPMLAVSSAMLYLIEPRSMRWHSLQGYSHWHYGSTPICAMRRGAPIQLA